MAAESKNTRGAERWERTWTGLQKRYGINPADLKLEDVFYQTDPDDFISPYALQRVVLLPDNLAAIRTASQRERQLAGDLAATLEEKDVANLAPVQSIAELWARYRLDPELRGVFEEGSPNSLKLVPTIVNALKGSLTKHQWIDIMEALATENALQTLYRPGKPWSPRWTVPQWLAAYEYPEYEAVDLSSVSTQPFSKQLAYALSQSPSSPVPLVRRARLGSLRRANSEARPWIYRSLSPQLYHDE
jgi:hypothetical protein